MEALRTTMHSARLAAIIDLPESLRDREVEVIVLPTGERAEMKQRNDERESVMGCLREYANPALRELEEGAWERAAAEKYLKKMQENECS